ncbi:MAG TPA: thiolase family protein [Acidimicrobiia bacterium]|jgi:acetyl-CoA acetyltransferase
MSAWVIGAGMLPCGRHSDTPLHELGAEAARLALDDAGLPYDQVGEVFTSSMLAPPQTALRVAHSLGRTGVPVTAIESASAGGLVALRHAAWAVWSGRCETALAVGYEKSTMLEPGGVVPKPRDVWDLFPPQLSYAIDATRFLYEQGQGPELFAAVAAKSWNCAARNELAARRPDHEVTIEEVLGARMVATPLTRMMCHASVDGAAAVVVSRDAVPEAVELLAVEQTSLVEDASWPRVGPTIGPPSQTARTARRAFEIAGIAPSDVGIVSLHDMCASEEVVTLVELGVCDADEIADLVFSGGLSVKGRLPTNVDGGCLARGHPMGATALAQTVDVVRQLRGRAAARQVADVHTGVVQTVGGGGSAAVAVLRRSDV